MSRYGFEHKFDIAKGRRNNDFLELYPQGTKKLLLYFQGEYFLQRLPADADAAATGPVIEPPERLGSHAWDILVPFDKIHNAWHVDSIRRNLLKLQLPEEDHPAWTSQLMEIANSSFADPQKTRLLTLSIHFKARVTITAKQGEEEEELILARAMDAGHLPRIFLVYRENKCSICLERLLAGDRLKFLRCFHRYHARCINAWLCKSKRPLCPMCRRPAIIPRPLKRQRC